MRKLFEISSEEKQRILEMHESATKKNYLSEQVTQPTKQGQPAAEGGTLINGVTYKLQGLTDKNINQFLDVQAGNALCYNFDPTLQKLTTPGADGKQAISSVAFCQVDLTTNPCCTMKNNIIDYLKTLAKYYKTPEEFKTYPFSKYTETAAKGQTFKSLWPSKMKEYLNSRSKEEGDLYDDKIAATLLGTTDNFNQNFDNKVFKFIVNGNLEKAGLPLMKV
jgi:hypothetical protein